MKLLALMSNSNVASGSIYQLSSPFGNNSALGFLIGFVLNIKQYTDFDSIKIIIRTLENPCLAFAAGRDKGFAQFPGTASD